MRLGCVKVYSSGGEGSQRRLRCATPNAQLTDYPDAQLPGKLSFSRRFVAAPLLPCVAVPNQTAAAAFCTARIMAKSLAARIKTN